MARDLGDIGDAGATAPAGSSLAVPPPPPGCEAAWFRWREGGGLRESIWLRLTSASVSPAEDLMPGPSGEAVLPSVELQGRGDEEMAAGAVALFPGPPALKLLAPFGELEPARRRELTAGLSCLALFLSLSYAASAALLPGLFEGLEVKAAWGLRGNGRGTELGESVGFEDG